MGQTTSISSGSLHNKIIEEIKNLIYKYNFWSSEDICDRLSIVYYDKLIQFKKDDILDASAYIGIKHDNEIDSKALCVKIINHYRKRLELMVEIKSALEKTYIKVFNSIKGPVCQNVNGFINDFFTCQKVNGIWLNEQQYQEIIYKIKKSDRHSIFYKHIKNLDGAWKKYLKRLQKIIEIIKKDVDNSLDDETFNDIVKHSRDNIIKLERVTDIYYLLIANFK